MLFTVTYRGSDGGRAHLELDVENKAAVWAELRRLKISAISVTEGRVKAFSQKKKNNSSLSKKNLNGIVLLCAVVAVVVTGFYFWSSANEKRGKAVATDTTIKESKGPSRGKPSAKANADSPKKVSAISKGSASFNAKAEKSPQASTDKPASTNAQETSQKPKKKVVFTNPMDQLMAMVMPREAGDAVPPVPISDDMEFTPEQEQQMFEQLTANDDDSEEVLERKELVQAMRNEYTELKTKRGWKFIDYIKALEAKARLDNEILTESVTIHETVFNDPNISDEEYLKTLGKINKILSERGIKEISAPSDNDESEAPSTTKEKNQ